MTTYYVGPMGNDNNSGKTWTTRLATLNGAEDKPVKAGDTVIVAPGVYREILTTDVSGTAADPITYIGDRTGERTNGVGGDVRITGSNNDTTVVRANGINITGEDHRIFQGFRFDMMSSEGIKSDSAEYLTVLDCSFVNSSIGIAISGNDTHALTIERCIFLAGTHGIYIALAAAQDDCDSLIQNCLFASSGNYGYAIRSGNIGGLTVRNCTFVCGTYGVYCANALNPGQTQGVYNCLLSGVNTALRAAVLGDLVEDYNSFYDNGVDRNNVNVGGNSNTYPPLYTGPMLVEGFRLPWWWGELSHWSQVKQITGSNEPDVDLFGMRRPYTHGGPVASLGSWGAVQWYDFRRDILRSHDGNVSARVKEKQKTHIFVPGISNAQHTISAYSYRTAGYGGHRNPEMVIKQPGQADRRTVAGGAAGAWVQVSDTFTPAADPPWLTVELWNQCDFTTTTTVSTTSTSTLSTSSTSTQTVSTVSTTTTTLACDVWWDDMQVT